MAHILLTERIDDRDGAGVIAQGTEAGTQLKVTVTSIQQQVLQGLVGAGGACPYRQLFRVCYGLRWEDMPGVERSRLGVSVRGLEKKGLVEISRRWGTWGYGQPETVTITDSGRALAETG